jgi:hypothetical protein
MVIGFGFGVQSLKSGICWFLRIGTILDRLDQISFNLRNFKPENITKGKFRMEVRFKNYV